jgi:hypothetical protein
VLHRLGLLPKDPCQALAVRVLRRKRLDILGMILHLKDILTYYTTLRIQYNSIIFNVHTSFASCISCTSGAAMQASLLVAASALDTEAEKLKSGDWKGYLKLYYIYTQLEILNDFNTYFPPGLGDANAR